MKRVNLLAAMTVALHDEYCSRRFVMGACDCSEEKMAQQYGPGAERMTKTLIAALILREPDLEVQS